MCTTEAHEGDGNDFCDQGLCVALPRLGLPSCGVGVAGDRAGRWSVGSGCAGMSDQRDRRVSSPGVKPIQRKEDISSTTPT